MSVSYNMQCACNSCVIHHHFHSSTHFVNCAYFSIFAITNFYFDKISEGISDSIYTTQRDDDVKVTYSVELGDEMCQRIAAVSHDNIEDTHEKCHLMSHTSM